MYNNYLQHHGILGQKWGIRRFQPYPKGHKGGKEVGLAARVGQHFTKEARAGRVNRRATKKLTRMDAKAQRAQDRANKYYTKAVRQSTSVFSSQKRVTESMNKAHHSQKEVNRMEAKGSRYYQRKVKKLGRLNSTANDQLKEIGERYLRNVEANSRSMYNTMLSSSGTINYRR